MQHRQQLVQLSLKLLGRLSDTTGSHHLQEGLALAALAFIDALYDPEPPQISGSQVSLIRWKHVRDCTPVYSLPTLWRLFARCMQNVQCFCMQQQSYGPHNCRPCI